MHNFPPLPEDADTLPRARSVAPPQFAEVMTPTAPVRQPSPLLLTGVIVVLVALMGAGIALAVHGGHPAQTSSQSALAILQHAEQAQLQDATFNITNVQTITVGSASAGATTLTTTTKGHGTLTRSPQRLHLFFDQTGDPTLQFTSNEIILDGSDTYVRLPIGLYPNVITLHA